MTMPRVLTLRTDRKRLAALLALSMTVADLAGRARVLEEAADELDGRRLRPRTGLSFHETEQVRNPHAKRGAGRLTPRHDQPPLSPGGPLADARGTERPLTDARGTERPLTHARGTEGAEWGLLRFADVEVLIPEKLAPREAAEFFAARIGMTRVAFGKLQRRYQEVAFTVARVESVAIIEEIQTVLADVLLKGETQAEFKRRVDDVMRRRGLSPLNPFHIETVFRTNVAQAYATGRVVQMRSADVRKALPWWRYLTVLDERVREKHQALHGFIARNDDPVWLRIYPPNGFNCRCQVVAVTSAKARRLARATKQDLDIEGARRLGAEPDTGFESSPVAAFERRLERGRLGLSTFSEWWRRAAA